MIYDISKWNEIRWAFVKAKAIFIRVAYDKVDSRYREHRANCRSRDIADYGYAWNLPIHNSEVQGWYVGALSTGMRKFALDVEKVILRGQLYYDVRPAGEYLKWWDGYEENNKQIKERYIYTNLYSWQSVVQMSAKRDVLELADRCKLWIAAYKKGDDGSVPAWRPLVPDPWDDWTLWQYTGKGTAPGFKNHVDINLLDGFIDDWVDKRELTWRDKIANYKRIWNWL